MRTIARFEGTTFGIVLRYSDEKDEFITHQFNIHTNEPNEYGKQWTEGFYWGHYNRDEEEAKEDFLARVRKLL